jgi:hypothetical protein
VRSFTPVAAPNRLLESITRLDGVPLPVCRPEAFAAFAASGDVA